MSPRPYCLAVTMDLTGIHHRCVRDPEHLGSHRSDSGLTWIDYGYTTRVAQLPDEANPTGEPAVSRPARWTPPTSFIRDPFPRPHTGEAYQPPGPGDVRITRTPASDLRNEVVIQATFPRPIPPRADHPAGSSRNGTPVTWDDSPSDLTGPRAWAVEFLLAVTHRAHRLIARIEGSP